MPRILWTVETARLAGRKSAARRAYLKANPPPPPPPPPSPPLPTVPLPLPTDPYARSQALEYRTQIARLVKLLSQCKDPTGCNKLAGAIDRLARHEAALSGRPGPGTFRPSRNPKPLTLTFDEPEPVEPGGVESGGAMPDVLADAAPDHLATGPQDHLTDADAADAAPEVLP